MNHSLSSRIRINLKENKPTTIAFISKPDEQIYPVTGLKDDQKILRGFIWKPKDRPVSKESIIPGMNKSKKSAPPPKLKTEPGIKLKQDSTMKTKRDSTIKPKPVLAAKPAAVK